MAIRKIVKRGNAALEKQCRPVDAFNKRLEILLGDLADTMYCLLYTSDAADD